MIIKELLNKIYPFLSSLSIAAAGLMLVFFGLSKRKGFKIFGIVLAAISIIAAIFLNIWSFSTLGDFSDTLFNFNIFAVVATVIILFAALNILIFISIINFHNDNFIKIILVFLTGVFFFMVFIGANNFIMIFTSFAVLLLVIFQLTSALSSRINKGCFSEYSVKNSIIRFYLVSVFSFLLTFMGYSLIYGSGDFKFYKQLLQSDKMASPLVITGLFIILTSLYIFMFLFPFQSAYIKMQNRIQYSSMQVVWFFYFPAGILMFFKLKDVLYYFLDKHSLPVTSALLAVSVICILGGNIGAIRTQGLRRIMSFLYLSMSGQIILGFAQFGLGVASNSRAVWLAVANIVFISLLYFPLGLFSSELENRFGSDKITNMAGYLRTQKYIGINLLILLLAFGGLTGTAGYVLRFIYLQPFLNGFNGLLSIGPDIRLSVLNISCFAVALISWMFIAANMIRLIFCLAKRPASGQTRDLATDPTQDLTSELTEAPAAGQTQNPVSGRTDSPAISNKEGEGRLRFSWFLYFYLTLFSIIVVLTGIMGLLELFGVNLNFLGFSLINLNF
jgi:hypothetical protein